MLDIHDLGLARERGGDVVGVAALVKRPLELRDDRGYWVHRSQLCTDELSVSTPSPCDLGNRRLGSDSTDSMPSLRA